MHAEQEMELESVTKSDGKGIFCGYYKGLDDEDTVLLLS